MSQSWRAGLSLATVCLGVLAAPLDSAVNIALPGISKALDAGLDDIRWIVICYVLTYSCLLLICGKIGDLIGYRVVLRAGLLVSSVGFALCGMTDSLTALLVGRVVQGIGIALTLSCAPALATLLYPASERVRVLGVYAAASATGAALGPIVGGVLVAHFGWSGVFWARAPLVLTALILTAFIPDQRPSERAKGFDYIGALLLILWLVALLLGLAIAPKAKDWMAPLVLWIAFLVTFALFVLREVRHPDPIIRPAHFRDARFAVMNVQSIAVNYAGFSILLLVPYYLVTSRELDSVAGGFVLALAGIGAAAGSSMAGRLASRVNVGWLSFAGLLLSVAGLFGIGLLVRSQTLYGVAIALSVHGIGLGLFQVAYTDLVTARLPIRDRGVAGSLTMLTRTIGVVAGATAHAAIQSAGESRAIAAGANKAEAFLSGLETAFLAAALAAGGALVLGLALALAPPGGFDKGIRSDEASAKH